MIGCKAVNALSKKLIAATAREGIKEIVEFAKGRFVSYNKEKSSETGVSVQFWPDPEVLEVVQFDGNKIQEMIQEFSFLCTGLRFTFKDINGKTTEYYSANGLNDYLKYLNNGKDFIFNPIYLEGKEGQYQIEAIVGYNDSYSTINRLYTNNIPQEKGTHLTGFKTAWTSTINNWAREKGILKEKDANLTGADLEEGQILILNFKMIDPVFKGQNKEELSSSEGRTYVQRIITEQLKACLNTREKDIKKIIDKALAARKAREAAKKARDAVRNIKPEKHKSNLDLPTKLVDANSKNRASCELLIAEGE